MRGWNENSPNFQSTKSRMMAVWDGLQQSADDDQDGQVNVDKDETEMPSRFYAITRIEFCR